MNKFMMSLLCGCAIICAAQTVSAKEDMPPPPPQMELLHKNKPDLAKRLNLSEEQKEKAEAVRLKGREQMKEMHKKMQELRKNIGYSQRELAEKSGVNLRTLQQYELKAKDINKAATTTLLALSKTLGCKIEDLLENV